jgi:hypothetical protein
VRVSQRNERNEASRKDDEASQKCDEASQESGETWGIHLNQNIAPMAAIPVSDWELVSLTDWV